MLLVADVQTSLASWQTWSHYCRGSACSGFALPGLVCGTSRGILAQISGSI